MNGFERYSDDLFDAHIGQGQIPIRDDWPPDLKARLAAALVSHNFGIGLDYAFKRYTSGHDYGPSSSKRVDLIFEGSFERTASAIHSAYRFEKEEFPDTEFFAGMSLIRSLQSLECAHRLAQRGYLFETIAVARTGMEQLAWSAFAAQMPSADGVLAVTTQYAIAKSKRRFLELGRLYGITSKFAHWHPQTHVAVFDDSSKGFGLLSCASRYKPTTLSMVGMLLSTCSSVFDEHMTKYWPGRSTAECRAAAGSLFSILHTTVAAAESEESVFHKELAVIWNFYKRSVGVIPAVEK